MGLAFGNGMLMENVKCPYQIIQLQACLVLISLSPGNESARGPSYAGTCKMEGARTFLLNLPKRRGPLCEQQSLLNVDVNSAEDRCKIACNYRCVLLPTPSGQFAFQLFCIASHFSLDAVRTIVAYVAP